MYGLGDFSNKHTLAFMIISYHNPPSIRFCISGTKLFLGSSMTPTVGLSQFSMLRNSPPLLPFCRYHVRLSVTQREQLRTIVDNVMRLFFNCPKLHNSKALLYVTMTATTPLQLQQTIKILTGSLKYKAIDGYFGDSVVYPGIW